MKLHGTVQFRPLAEFEVPDDDPAREIKNYVILLDHETGIWGMGVYQNGQWTTIIPDGGIEDFTHFSTDVKLLHELEWGEEARKATTNWGPPIWPPEY